MCRICDTCVNVVNTRMVHCTNVHSQTTNYIDAKGWSAPKWNRVFQNYLPHIHPPPPIFNSDDLTSSGLNTLDCICYSVLHD